MANDSDILITLNSIQTNSYRYGGPILMTIGTVSCILNLSVFTRRNLRKNSCSIYFIAFNIASLFLIYTSLFTSTLALGYNINPSISNLIFCRCRFYALTLFDVLSPSYLILASIDRIFVTSRNARTRQRSTSRFAYLCILFVTLFWSLLHIPALIFTNIIEFLPNVILCYLQPGIYLKIISYYSIIVKGILIPLLMFIFGLWTLKNIRNPNLRTTRPKDRQLIRLLLVDISVYIIFSLMISFVLMYQQLNQSRVESFFRIQIQIFLLSIALFCSYIPFCIVCYTNLLVSKSFRQEVRNIFQFQ
ncbi:hypothetical protein I4U23_004982 [Adineta vaga]|nr:hypothetical protein I4U23_004982 [Adineta vaga]